MMKLKAIQGDSLSYMRLYYLVWFIAGGFLFPFVNIFFDQRGLSGTEIGWISSIAALVGMLIAPIWGRWNDKPNANPRTLLQVALVGSALIYFLIGLQTAFLWILFLAALEPLASAAMEPIASTEAMAATEGRKEGFGSIRLWGSIGWAIGAPLAGWLMERLGLMVPFAGYAIFLLLGAWIVRYVEFHPRNSNPETGTPKPSTLQLTKTLAGNRSMVGLAIALVILWLSGFGLVQFEGIYMKKLGAGDFLVGFTNAIAILEIPAMLFADRLIRKYGSGVVLHISVLAQAIGYVAVLISPTIEMVVFSKLIANLQYSFYVIALTSYTIEGAPTGQESTVLAFYNVTLRCIITLIGSPLTGWLFELMGGYSLYILALGGTFLSWLILLLTARKPKQPENLQ